MAPLSKSKAKQTQEKNDVEKVKGEKGRKKKKRRGHQTKFSRQERRDGNPVAIGANATKAIEGQKMKWRDRQGSKKDIFEMTCYNCNKKCYYSKYCTKPKN